LGRGALERADGEGNRCWTFVFSTGELYGLSDIGGGRSEATLELESTAVGLDAGALGSNLYRERHVALSLERRLTPDMAGVVRVAAMGISGAGHGSLWTGVLDVLVYRTLLGRILLAAQYDNVAQSAVGGSRVPSRASHSVSLTLDGVIISALVESEPGFDMSTAIGFEASISEWLRVRAGATADPGTFSAGIGVGRTITGRGPHFPVTDIAWRWHPVLGTSYFASISFDT
jgi:hypothetical protein